MKLLLLLTVVGLITLAVVGRILNLTTRNLPPHLLVFRLVTQIPLTLFLKFLLVLFVLDLDPMSLLLLLPVILVLFDLFILVGMPNVPLLRIRRPFVIAFP